MEELQKQRILESFINESKLIFSDISSEEFREYLLFTPDKPLKIEGKPMKLNVSESGGHRIFTSSWCYYIQPKEGWAIRWKVENNKPNFVK